MIHKDQMESFQNFPREIQEGALEIALALESKKVYSTIGVYPSGSCKHNAVSSEHITHHIAYNMFFRWGRALLVDGKCVYQGNVDDVVVANFEKHFEEHPRTPTEPSPPYQ